MCLYVYVLKLDSAYLEFSTHFLYILYLISDFHLEMNTDILVLYCLPSILFILYFTLS